MTHADDRMVVRRRRVYIAFVIVLTFIYLFYGTGSESDSLTLSPRNMASSDYMKNDIDGKDTIIIAMSHPSVFQRWRDHSPPTTNHSVIEDCLKMKGLNVQRMCSEQLHHVKNYCSKRQGENNYGASTGRRVGGVADGVHSGASDAGAGEKRHINIQKGGVRGGVHVDGGGIKSRNIVDDDVDNGVGGAGEKGNDSIDDGMVDVFSYRHGKTMMMFCSVHKVASTFWIRLFRFLHHDLHLGRVTNPEVISKYHVHLTPFNQSRPLALQYVRRMLRPGDEEFRFMFTRDPYRRLWSVYIDKFVLPDFFFWTRHVTAIKEDSLKNSDSNNTRPRRRHPNVCADVSFEEFVEYTVRDRSSPSSHSDDHMLPISRTCNPCSFDPNFIGRLEHMGEASQAVLERLNLTFLNKQRTFKQQILSQMRTVTEFVYDTVVDRGNLRHCMSNEELQARLLRAFVLSGYLPPGVTWAKRPPVITSLSPLLSMVEKLFLSFNRTHAQVEEQRNQFFVTAYQSLPRTLLLKVRDYYKEDFDSFGYDPEPSELFSDLAVRLQNLPVDIT